MGFIKDAVEATEKAATKAVINSKINSLLKDMHKHIKKQKEFDKDVQLNLNESTNLISSIANTTFNVFITGFEKIQEKFVSGIEESGETVANLVARNKTEIVEITTAVKTIIDRSKNKEDIKTIFNTINNEMSEYLNGEFTDLLDKVGDEEITPKVVELAKIWGKKHRYFLRDENDTLFEVSEEEYYNAKNNRTQWFETESFLRTEQSTIENFEEAKRTGRQTYKTREANKFKSEFL